MILQAYSLDQLLGITKDVLRSLNFFPEGLFGGINWDVLKTRYFGGKEAVREDGNILRLFNNDSPVHENSKFAYYLGQALKTGTLSEIINYEDPLIATVVVSKNRVLSHSEWLLTTIYDVGNVSDIVAKQNVKVFMKYLPPEVKLLQTLQGNVPRTIKHDFEIWFNYCHDGCGIVDFSQKKVCETLEAATRL